MEELLPLLARCTGPDTYQIVLSAPTDPEEAENASHSFGGVWPGRSSAFAIIRLFTKMWSRMS